MKRDETSGIICLHSISHRDATKEKVHKRSGAGHKVQDVVTPSAAPHLLLAAAGMGG